MRKICSDNRDHLFVLGSFLNVLSNFFKVNFNNVWRFVSPDGKHQSITHPYGKALAIVASTDMEVQQLDLQILRMLLILIGEHVVFQMLKELIAFVPLRQHESFQCKNNHIRSILLLQE